MIVVLQKKHYKDQLNRQLAQPWQQEASDGDIWRSSVRKASRKFGAERHEAVQEGCRRQREQAASQSSSAQTVTVQKVQ